MLLRCKGVRVDCQNGAFSHVSSLPLDLNLPFSPPSTLCLHPVCLLIFSRLKVFKVRFRGVFFQKYRTYFMGGSVNHHRKVFYFRLFTFCHLVAAFYIKQAAPQQFKQVWLYSACSVFGSICLFVLSYSSFYSFTHKQIELKNRLTICQS